MDDFTSMERAAAAVAGLADAVCRPRPSKLMMDCEAEIVSDVSALVETRGLTCRMYGAVASLTAAPQAPAGVDAAWWQIDDPIRPGGRQRACVGDCAHHLELGRVVAPNRLRTRELQAVLQRLCRAANLHIADPIGEQWNAHGQRHREDGNAHHQLDQAEPTRSGRTAKTKCQHAPPVLVTQQFVAGLVQPERPVTVDVCVPAWLTVYVKGAMFVPATPVAVNR